MLLVLILSMFLALPAQAALPLLDFENTFFGSAIDVHDITIRGNTAYLAADDRFYTWDVSDPTNVLPLGQFVTTNSIGVAVDGTLAFVADANRFRVLNVANPAAPAQLDFLVMDEAVDVAVNPATSLAYVANATSIGDLVVVDYSDPFNISVVATVTTVSNPQGVFYVNDTLYLADGLGGLRIYDVSGVTPVQTGFFSNSRFYVNVFAQNDFIYAVDSTFGLTTLEETGGNPTLRSSIAVIGSPKDVIANCSGLYLVTAVATSQLQVYDISTPQAPMLDDITFIGGVDIEALDVQGEIVITGGTSGTPKMALYDTGFFCDDTDADGNCLCGDPCPSFQNDFPLPEPGSAGDPNGDGIPNECQCGDPNDNGAPDNGDLTFIYTCLTEISVRDQCNTVFATGKADTNLNPWFDNNDLTRIFFVLTGQNATWELTCANRPEGTMP